MFISEEEKYHLNSIEKLGLFEKAEQIEKVKPHDLVKNLINKADNTSSEEYFEYILELLKNYGIYFAVNSRTSVADLLGNISVSIYGTGYQPKEYTVSFLGKSFKDKKLASLEINKYLKSEKINELLTENRGFYLQEMQGKDSKVGFYLLKHGLKFSNKEKDFFKFTKTGLFS